MKVPERLQQATEQVTKLKRMTRERVNLQRALRNKTKLNQAELERLERLELELTKFRDSSIAMWYDLGISQSKLAAYFGIQPSTISRTLKQLKEEHDV